MMKSKLLLIALALIGFSASYQFSMAQEPFYPDYGQDLPPFSEAELIPLNALPALPVPPLYSTPGAPVLPPIVNNALHPYFRGAYNQAGLSCGQAAFIGYNFTYEVNRVRNLPATDPANQFPTHFAWNWANGGNGWWGASYFHTADLMKHVGTPDVNTYGGMSAGGGTRWMTGYNNYYLAMQNRIYDAYAINVSTPEGLKVLKHYLHDHLEGSPYGGFANFFANQPPLQTLPPGTPEAGKKVVIQWSTFSHALTVVGYNDLICWDYNNDGQYTNHLDINGDGVVDMRDWEIGGLLFVNSYGGVPNWGDGGFAYMMYKTLAEPYGSGGIWNNSVHVMKPKEMHEPQLTMKVTIKHNSREKLRVTAGVSLNPYATVPDVETDFPIINYQGAHRPMQGDYTEEAKILEFGLDITSLLGYVPSGQTARYFFRVYERDPINEGTGDILAFSLMDYTNGPTEIICPGAPTPIIENGITTLWINTAINYDAVSITTDSLPNAKFYEPYSYQLEADGGSSPYHWFFRMDYDETLSNQTFPNISAEQLVPTNNTSGFATKALDFEFPYYGELYDTLFIHVNGAIIFDRQNYPYPYTHEPLIVFKAYKAIAPFNFNLRLYSGQGIWYEGDENSATFRWKASVNENPGSELNFAVRLYPDGNIEYYYGNMEYPAQTAWIGGLSNGDYRAYQFLSFNGDPQIQPNKKVNFDAPDFAPGMKLTPDGILQGTPDRIYSNRMLTFMAIDNNDLFTTKTLSFSTAGLMIDYAVHSGSNNVLEFGETATLDIAIKSMEPETISNASMSLSIDDLYITMIDSVYQIGTIAPGDSVVFNDAFSFSVSNLVPNNHPLNFNLVVHSPDDSWSRQLVLTAYSPVVKPVIVIVQDGNNGILDPGETTDIAVQFKNLGGATLNQIELLLSSNDPNVTINQGQATISALNPGEGQFVTFNISVSEDLIPGEIVVLTAHISGHNDYENISSLIIQTSVLVEDFESGSFESFPWQFSGNQPWVIENVGAWEGSFCARSGGITHNQSSVMFLEGEVLMPDTISFYRKVSSETNYDYLKFFINGALMGQWSGTVPWGRVAYPVSAGSNVFKWEYMKDGSVSNGSDCAWVDYITFPLMGSCQPPHNLSASNITASSALLQWLPGNTELLWDLVYGAPGFDPNTQGTLIEDLTETEFLLTGLSATTYYGFYVRSYCGSGEYSAWSGPVIFMTSCETYSLPFVEEFSGTSVSCWTFPQGQSNWNFGSSYTPPSSVSGAPNAYFSWNPAVTNYSFSLTSPILSAVNMMEVMMDYLLFINNYDNNNLEQMTVQYKAMEDETWTLLENFTNEGLGSSNVEYQRTNQLLEGMQGKQFQVRFMAHGINSFSINGWGLDDVHIHGEVSAILPGDANCDGIVNVIDLVTIINYIVGMNPDPFCFENADANSDGLINVLDAVQTVNIILGGQKNLHAGLKSQTAFIYLDRKGVWLRSDGTLAGLQFEIEGLKPDQFMFNLDGFEFRTTVHENKLMGLIFSFDNKPIPAGMIPVLTFSSEPKALNWGEVIAANRNADKVEVIRNTHFPQLSLMNDFAVSVFPNPSPGNFTVSISTPKLSEVQVNLFDMMGRQLSTLHDGVLPEGTHFFEIGEELSLRTGVYLVRVQAASFGEDEKAISKFLKIVITR